MVNIDWCCRQKSGIKLTEPNDNLANAYMEMAYEALRVMDNEKGKSLRWTISSCYYSMYYSLYAVLQKIGIKCEIHVCTLELIKFALLNFYSCQECFVKTASFRMQMSILEHLKIQTNHTF